MLIGNDYLQATIQELLYLYTISSKDYQSEVDIKVKFNLFCWPKSI